LRVSVCGTLATNARATATFLVHFKILNHLHSGATCTMRQSVKRLGALSLAPRRYAT
jgi:hypothetical protein